MARSGNESFNMGCWANNNALMLIDLFMAIPITLTILSGLGVELGVLYSSIGMIGSKTMGYIISRFMAKNY